MHVSDCENPFQFTLLSNSITLMLRNKVWYPYLPNGIRAQLVSISFQSIFSITAILQFLVAGLVMVLLLSVHLAWINMSQCFLWGSNRNSIAIKRHTHSIIKTDKISSIMASYLWYIKCLRVKAVQTRNSIHAIVLLPFRIFYGKEKSHN